MNWTNTRNRVEGVRYHSNVMYGGLECELMTARQGGGDQTPYHTQCLRPHYKHPYSKSLARFNLF